jgi:hypothetical protein
MHSVIRFSVKSSFKISGFVCSIAFCFVPPCNANTILNQSIIYDQDPWDAQSQLGSSNCHSNPDGSLTCDTRPRGQAWVETYGTGYN